METPWYTNGLRFSCTRCGNCCTGEAGFVWVDENEIQAIADRLKVSVEEVIGIYTKILYEKRSLKEKLNGDCVFFEKEKGCTIYDIRPRQCRTWPFWESTTRTEEAWQRTQRNCPGAGQGELIPVEEITRRIRVIKI
jgi:Fe-S-cluster containining protein